MEYQMTLFDLPQIGLSNGELQNHLKKIQAFSKANGNGYILPKDFPQELYEVVDYLPTLAAEGYLESTFSSFDGSPMYKLKEPYIIWNNPLEIKEQFVNNVQVVRLIGMAIVSMGMIHGNQLILATK